MSKEALRVQTETPVDTAVLPAGRHFAVTWSVPTVFAGRTNAMLHRSMAFAATAGVTVEILTFDNFSDYQEISKTLTARGQLSAGVKIRNIWDDLPSMSQISVGTDQDFSAFQPLAEWNGPVSTELDRHRPRRIRYAEDGTTVLQTDFYRPDGTVFLSDRNDSNRAGEISGRTLTLCDNAGKPVQNWNTSWVMYRAWLDYVTADQPSYFIVDHLHVGGIMSTYRRSHAVVMYMLHESHLQNAENGPTSALTAFARSFFPRLDNFDGFVILTESQARHIRHRIGDRDNLYVIPNSRTVGSSADALKERDPSAGVVLAMLHSRKRIDHAIRAVNLANQNTDLSVSLDVFGDGAQRMQLVQLISELGAGNYVNLQGYVPSAKNAFEEASFSLLTSTSEGFGLVIVESMAAGCIPIAYDLCYGPSSIITHGVNGFIVEYGNVEALAECIAYVRSLPENELFEIRKAAMKRADDFSDNSVSRLWNAAFVNALERKIRPQLAASVTILASSIAWHDGGALGVSTMASIDGSGAPEEAGVSSPRFSCMIKDREGPIFFRTHGVQQLDHEGRYTVNFHFDSSIVSSLSNSIMDVYLETQIEATTVITKVPLRGVPRTMATNLVHHGNMSLRF